MASSIPFSMESVAKRPSVTTWAIISASELVWKIAPLSSSSSFSSSALTRLPLWATTMGPLTWRITKGWESSRVGMPMVEYRTWPTAIWPGAHLFQVIPGEHIRHQAHVLIGGDDPAVVDRDAAALLAPVL